jgi:hypothetical protein
VSISRSRLLPVLAAVALAAAAVTAAPAMAGSVVDVQANNPQVPGQPGAVFPTNKSNEPSIAVDPGRNQFLIAGANDEQEQPACGAAIRSSTPGDCSFFPGVGTDGVYTSSDSGHTWLNRGLIDDQAGWKASPLVSDGDPVLFFGPRPDKKGNRAYYVGLASYKPGQSPYPAGKAPELISLSYSDDDGVTWSAPTIAATKANPNNFNDKPSAWADLSPASPFYGQVYVAWTQFRSASVNGQSAPVLVSRSTDFGATFGAPNKLSPAYNNGGKGGRQGSAVRTGPDGTVYVVWEEASTQVVAVSTDGGASYGKFAVAGQVADIADPIPGANFRTDSFASLATDPRAGSTTAYLSWVNRTAGGGRLVVATSTDRGATWSAPVTVSGSGNGYAFFQGLDVASTGRVDVAFQGLVANDPAKFGTGNARIDSWYASRPPAGSWSAPRKVSSVSSDPAASAQNNLQRQFWGDYSTLVSTGSAAYFIYTDSRNGIGCPAVDNYQQALIAAGVPVAPDDQNAGTDASSGGAVISKPVVPADCGAQFGNSDTFVSVIAP